jgi:hypothetical protein
MSIYDDLAKQEAKELGVSLLELARIRRGETMDEIIACRERVAKQRARSGEALALDTWRRIAGAKKD